MNVNEPYFQELLCIVMTILVFIFIKHIFKLQIMYMYSSETSVIKLSFLRYKLWK